MKILFDKVKIWVFYFFVVFISIYLHEIGHCLVAWVNGIKAIPTPAKEYELNTIPVHLENPIAAGGVIATLLTAFVGIIIFLKNPSKTNAIILGGTMASPFVYTVLFLLKGRGHDSTEFQKAQSAMGLSYSGHFIDWMFLFLTASAIIIWCLTSRPNSRNIFTVFLGSIMTIVFVAFLQVVNNAVFDPIFAK